MRTSRSKLPALPLLLAVLTPLWGCAMGGTPNGGEANLEGTIWTVLEIHGDMPPEEADTTPFIRIDSERGQVTGDTGCNTFNGPYRADGARLIMGPFGVTRSNCELEVDRFEEHLLEALRATTLYRIHGGVLYLYLNSDTPSHIQFEIGA